MRHAEMARLISDLGATVADQLADDPAGALASVAQAIPDLIEHCTATGIVEIVGDGADVQVVPLAASSDDAAVATALLAETGEGPAFALEGVDVVVGDLPGDPRWSSWASAAADVTGAQSVMAVLLPPRTPRLGALLLFCDVPADQLGEDREATQVVTGLAAVTLSAARQVGQLRDGLEYRALIGQATGIVMERFDVDADRAFDVLRRHSQDTNQRIRDLAAALVSDRRPLTDL